MRVTITDLVVNIYKLIRETLPAEDIIVTVRGDRKAVLVSYDRYKRWKEFI